MQQKTQTQPCALGPCLLGINIVLTCFAVVLFCFAVILGPKTWSRERASHNSIIGWFHKVSARLVSSIKLPLIDNLFYFEGRAKQINLANQGCVSSCSAVHAVHDLFIKPLSSLDTWGMDHETLQTALMWFRGLNPFSCNPQNDGKLSNKQKITQCFLSIICYIDTCNVLQGVIHCNAAVLVMVRVVMYRVKETAKGKNLIKFLPLLWPSDRMFVPILMTYEPVKWLFMVYHNKFLKRHTLAKYEEPECAFPTNYEGDMLWSFSIPHKLEGTLVRV